MIKIENFTSPLVKSIANKENISLEELNKIAGTGLNNRVSKKDVLKYVEIRNNSNIDNSESLPLFSDNDLEKSSLSNDVKPMGHVRLMIADHMKKSRDTCACILNI